MSNENKIGYVLSGGGARGIAHLGVIQYLEELDCKPYAIAGASAGAIAGAFYAAGKSPQQILTLIKNNHYFGWNRIAWGREGFFSMKAMRELMEREIVVQTFEELPIKLFVSATDLVKGSAEVLSEGNLFEAVIASASVPVVFEPVIIGSKHLVDGGFLNNFPVEPLLNICETVIGSYVNKVEVGYPKKSYFSTINILERCFHLATANTVYSKANLCDVFIEVPLQGINMYDTTVADEVFEAGYTACKQHSDSLKKMIQREYISPRFY